MSNWGFDAEVVFVAVVGVVFEWNWWIYGVGYRTERMTEGGVVGEDVKGGMRRGSERMMMMMTRCHLQNRHHH